MNMQNYLFDILALSFFFLCWLGYDWYARRKSGSVPSLLGAMLLYRKLWMQRMVIRDSKIVDSTIVGNLMRMITFFASTTILIIAAIFAALGSVENVGNLTNNLPLVPESPLEMLQARFVILLLIFIYAFFKFTWSLRQNNFVSILIGAVGENDEDSYKADLVDKTSRLESLAADSFTKGLRAYYFALAFIAWFLHPLLFMLASIVIVFVINRREFHSATLEILHNE